VGDNVGDIAGMGADLFGSFAESTCAAMVLMSSQTEFILKENGVAIFYPMIITAFGILVCIFTSFIGTNLMKVNENK
jgi:Na+/H+-translocating membrane pyrophosphatase